MKRVGVIGCGIMGKGIVKNLLSKGYKVDVYDKDIESMNWCEEIGAIPKSSPAEIGEDNQVVITSLPSPEIVKDVIDGENGLLKSLKSNSYILDLSTIDPVTAQELYQKSKEKDVYIFDCPVSGGPVGAENGTLTLMVGGNEKKLPVVKSVMEDIGEVIIYLGDSGSGQMAKICHNMLVGIIISGLGEVFTVGSKAGLSPHKLAQVINNGTAQNRVLSVHPNMVDENFEEALFTLSHMCKDINLYTKTASNYNVPVLIGSLVSQLYEASKTNGKGDLDSTGVCETIKELAGVSSWN